MLEKLEQLRQKTDQQKRYIAFGVAGGITGVIFLFWVVSLSVTISSQDQGANTGNAVAAASGGESPVAAMVANVSAALAPVSNSFQQLVSTISAATSTATTSVVSNNSSSLIATSTTASSIDHLLIPGDTGSEVLLLQQVLTTQGFYNGPLNAKLGPLTETALVNFQAAHHIVAPNMPGSGQVGPITRDLINSLSQQ